jgi:hypothetical protein
MKQFCPRGHDTFICGRGKTGYCKMCHNANTRRWARNNIERCRKNAKRWRTANLEKCKENDRKWREVHLEQIRERARQWQKDNPKKARKRNKKWKKDNPGKVAQARIMHKIKRNLCVPKFGQKGIVEFYDDRPKNKVVDHRIPLLGKLVSGLHVIWNLQYLTVAENNKKHNSFDGTLKNNSWRKK